MERLKKQVIVSLACIVQSNKILFRRRPSSGVADMDGLLEFPGGKVEFGERPEDAAIRETQEEVGIQVEVERLIPLIQSNLWSYPDKEVQAILLCFICRIKGHVDIPAGQGWEWFTLEQLEKEKVFPGTDRFLAWFKEHVASKNLG